MNFLKAEMLRNLVGLRHSPHRRTCRFRFQSPTAPLPGGTPSRNEGTRPTPVPGAPSSRPDDPRIPVGCVPATRSSFRAEAGREGVCLETRTRRQALPVAFLRSVRVSAWVSHHRPHCPIGANVYESSRTFFFFDFERLDLIV